MRIRRTDHLRDIVPGFWRIDAYTLTVDDREYLVSVGTSLSRPGYRAGFITVRERPTLELRHDFTR